MRSPPLFNVRLHGGTAGWGELMYLSHLQFAKFVIWLQEVTASGVSFLLVFDMFLRFQNRQGVVVYLLCSCFIELFCLLYTQVRFKCPACKRRLKSSQIRAMDTFLCPHCGWDRF